MYGAGVVECVWCVMFVCVCVCVVSCQLSEGLRPRTYH